MQFSVAVDGGSIVGWDVGEGTPALILHGGPTSDNTEALPDLLPPALRTIRYQQRGIEPSTLAEPYDTCLPPWPKPTISLKPSPFMSAM